MHESVWRCPYSDVNNSSATVLFGSVHCKCAVCGRLPNVLRQQQTACAEEQTVTNGGLDRNDRFVWVEPDTGLVPIRKLDASPL